MKALARATTGLQAAYDVKVALLVQLVGVAVGSSCMQPVLDGHAWAPTPVTARFPNPRRWFAAYRSSVSRTACAPT